MKKWPWPDEPPLVLAVDDQVPNLRLLGQVLTEAGIDVMPANSGSKALSRLRAASPDLVVLDLRMPGLSGLDVLREIRADQAWQDLPVILCTAAHEKPTLLRALSSGADDYLLKPFEPEELLSRVALHAELARRRRLDQVAAHSPP